jgi:hypothetical protein
VRPPQQTPHFSVNTTASTAVPSLWMHSTVMKSSGVSRFLSRRDKNHEKRKSAPGKVCLPASASSSCTSLTPLLHHWSSAQRLQRVNRRYSQSLDSLYHKLPSAVQSPVEDGFLFIQRNTPSLPSFTSVAQHSPQRLSDQLFQQSRLSKDVSPDLYTIFTNEDKSPTPDKDVEKKVRRSLSTLRPAVD